MHRLDTHQSPNQTCIGAGNLPLATTTASRDAVIKKQSKVKVYLSMSDYPSQRLNMRVCNSSPQLTTEVLDETSHHM